MWCRERSGKKQTNLTDDTVGGVLCLRYRLFVIFSYITAAEKGVVHFSRYTETDLHFLPTFHLKAP